MYYRLVTNGLITKGTKRKGSIVNYRSFAIPTLQQETQEQSMTIRNQYCGFVTFRYRYGSRNLIMDPDPAPNPAIFITDIQDANKKLSFFLSFSAFYFLKEH
jgi:hypothetical protein